MRILIVSHYFPPDITAAAFRIGDFAKAFARAGHEIAVLTTEPHRGTAQDAAPPDPALESVRVRRTHLREIGSGGFVNYVAHYLSFVVGSVWQAGGMRLGGYRPDVIWVTSPPLFAGLAGRIMAALFGCPMVLDIRDIWPESAVSAGQLRDGGQAFRIGKRLERYLYTRARAITCVARPMAEYIRGQTQVPVTVIYNGVPASEMEGRAAPAARQEGPRQILYAGNLGRVQQLDLLIRAVADLKQAGEFEGWRVRIVGGGALREELAVQVEQLGLAGTVAVEAPMSREKVFDRLCSADLLYLSLKPDAVLRMTIPSKLFDYLMAARPIIGGIAGEGREILAATGANSCFEPGDLASLRATLLEATHRCGELDSSAPKNRALVLQRFTRERAADQLLDVLTGAAKRGRQTGKFL